MITRPLELQSRLSSPPRDLDSFAWVNVGLIVVFFSLLGSRFVLAPGVPVGVGDDGFQLPRATGAIDGAVPASVVVSFRRENVILFEGGMYSLVELQKHLDDYARTHPQSVLLVRLDRQVSAQDLVSLCEMARQAGFAKVLIAAEPNGPGQPANGSRAP